MANVLVQTDPEAKPPYTGQTIFTIEKTSGIDITPIHGKMGQRSQSTSEVAFINVVATDEDIARVLGKCPVKYWSGDDQGAPAPAASEAERLITVEGSRL